MRITEERPGPMEVRRVKQGRTRNQRKCRALTGHALEPSKTSKPKGQRRREDVLRRNKTRNRPQAGYQGPPKVVLNTSRTIKQGKRKHQFSRTEEQSANDQRTFLRKPRATAEINAKIENSSYHKTWDGGKSLIKPFLSSHVGISLIKEAIQPLPTPA